MCKVNQHIMDESVVRLKFDFMQGYKTRIALWLARCLGIFQFHASQLFTMRLHLLNLSLLQHHSFQSHQCQHLAADSLLNRVAQMQNLVAQLDRFASSPSNQLSHSLPMYRRLSTSSLSRRSKNSDRFHRLQEAVSLLHPALGQARTITRTIGMHGRLPSGGSGTMMNGSLQPKMKHMIMEIGRQPMEIGRQPKMKHMIM